MPERPGVVPHCAGRVALAHERTSMALTGSGWECPACGERADMLTDLTEKDGHAEGCSYPRTMEAGFIRLGRAQREFVAALGKAWGEQVRRLRRGR